MPSNEELLDYIYAKQLEIENLTKYKLKNITSKRFKYENIKRHVDLFINEKYEYYPRLIVMPGLRGIGKTTILYQLYDYLVNENEDSLSTIDLFYDAEKKGVDFLIKMSERIIPIEVGIGKKTKGQITKSMDKYNTDIGILVSNRTSRIKYENNIIYVPVSTFALI